MPIFDASTPSFSAPQPMYPQHGPPFTPSGDLGSDHPRFYRGEHHSVPPSYPPPPWSATAYPPPWQFQPLPGVNLAPYPPPPPSPQQPCAQTASSPRVAAHTDYPAHRGPRSRSTGPETIQHGAQQSNYDLLRFIDRRLSFLIDNELPDAVATALGQLPQHVKQLDEATHQSKLELQEIKTHMLQLSLRLEGVGRSVLKVEERIDAGFARWQTPPPPAPPFTPFLAHQQAYPLPPWQGYMAAADRQGLDGMMPMAAAMSRESSLQPTFQPSAEGDGAPFDPDGADIDTQQQLMEAYNDQHAAHSTGPTVPPPQQQQQQQQPMFNPYEGIDDPYSPATRSWFTPAEVQLLRQYHAQFAAQPTDDGGLPGASSSWVSSMPTPPAIVVEEWDDRAEENSYRPPTCER